MYPLADFILPPHAPLEIVIDFQCSVNNSENLRSLFLDQGCYLLCIGSNLAWLQAAPELILAFQGPLTEVDSNSPGQARSYLYHTF